MNDVPDVKPKQCDLCKKQFNGWGNNPAPLAGKVCCNECNQTLVIPERIRRIVDRT